MFSKPQSETKPSNLPTILFICILVALGGMILLSVSAAPAAGQTGNETADNQSSIIYQFDGGEELVDVVYDEGRAEVTLRADDRATTFSVAEGAVDEEGSFNFQTVRVKAGDEQTVSIPVRDEAISVTTQNDGYYHEGDLGLTVVTSTPTSELLQIAGLSGIIGTLLSLGIVIGQLRRKHENSYKELFSEERHEIESDPIEGYYERAKDIAQSATDSKYRTAGLAAVVVYVFAALFGLIPTPGELWLSLGDTQRLIVVGSLAAAMVGLLPVYWLVKKIWNPDREFVLDLDSRDVYQAYGGDKSGGVAAYSAPPSRISDLEVDGGITTMSTPGGRCHLVRGFSPEDNEAEGNPPEIADDREVSIEVQKIDHNRRVLTDLATIGRDLIGAMTAFRVTADASAMRDIDSGIRDTVSAGSDSLEDVLSDAVEGTRYEGTYQPDAAVEAAINEQDEAMTDDTPTVDDSNGSSATAATDGGKDNE